VTEASWDDGAVYLTAVLVIVDGLMTLPFWHYESNPVVLGLGPVGMMLVKIGAVCGLLWLWFRWPGVQDSLVTRTCVMALCVLYTVVVVTNVGYLLLG